MMVIRPDWDVLQWLEVAVWFAYVRFWPSADTAAFGNGYCNNIVSVRMLGIGVNRSKGTGTYTLANRIVVEWSPTIGTIGTCLSFFGRSNRHSCCQHKHNGECDRNDTFLHKKYLLSVLGWKFIWSSSHFEGANHINILEPYFPLNNSNLFKGYFFCLNWKITGFVKFRHLLSGSWNAEKTQFKPVFYIFDPLHDSWRFSKMVLLYFRMLLPWGNLWTSLRKWFLTAFDRAPKAFLKCRAPL